MTTVVLDIETTGLDPHRHHIWEIALIVEGHRESHRNGEWWWQTEPNLSEAEPIALRKSRYYERQRLSSVRSNSVLIKAPRRKDESSRVGETDRPQIARDLARILDQAVVYAAVPTFDVGFLETFMRRHFQAPTWDHRVRCVESMTEGALGRPIGGLRDCADALDIDYDPDELHSALADARLAAKIRDAVTFGEENTG